MRLAIIGQQDFGKPDPLRSAAEHRSVPIYQLPSLKTAAALEALRHRGPSSINWPIIRGDERTGLVVRTFSQVKGKIGAVTAIEGQSVFVAAQAYRKFENDWSQPSWR